jgi:hypothetical protein
MSFAGNEWSVGARIILTGKKDNDEFDAEPALCGRLTWPHKPKYHRLFLDFLHALNVVRGCCWFAFYLRDEDMRGEPMSVRDVSTRSQR